MTAVFAALTAIFAKIDIQGFDSDLATLVRTVIVIVMLSAFVWFAGKWSNPFTLSPGTSLFAQPSRSAYRQPRCHPC